MQDDKTHQFCSNNNNKYFNELENNIYKKFKLSKQFYCTAAYNIDIFSIIDC